MSEDSEATKQIVTHLMGIPFFDRLSEAEVEKIFSICSVVKYQPDQVIYKFGKRKDKQIYKSTAVIFKMN